MQGRCKHDLVEMLVVAVCASLCGADSFVEITQWAEAKLDWLKQFLKRLVLGQQACAEKSNEKTAIPELLESLLLKGAIVTIDAMGTHASIAKGIRAKEADYVLAVKDNQALLADSIRTFFEIGRTEQWRNTPHDYVETIDKDHGRIETRRYWTFTHLDCLSRPEQWPDLRMFGVVESERHIVGGGTTVERRLYIGSIPADAKRFAHAVRSHWAIENRLHWCLDVVRKGGIKVRRLVASASDAYRAQLLGLHPFQ
jgi:predicted transposase YbfD/YdcC